VGVTRERFVTVSCLGWKGNSDELRNHPFRTEKTHWAPSPHWCQSALLRTDQGHISRSNVFWRCVAHGERAHWFGDQATLYMENAGVHGNILRARGSWGIQPAPIPEYWKSDMLPESMRHESGHGGSAVFISAEFVNALLEDREPAIDIYESLAMTVPGLVAHQSALKDGEQMNVPQFDLPKKA
jgi:hypothetical protein